MLERTHERRRGGRAGGVAARALQRVTAITCSPSRRYEALANGSGAFCVPFDSIPAVNDPRFDAATRESLSAREPVIALSLAGSDRAYPIRYLVFHEA